MNSLNATIYIVDDDPSVRKSLNRLLSGVGYNVTTFSSANEFLQNKIEVHEPACLILDVKMPGLSGFGLQEKLNSANDILPIIFITGFGDIPSSVKAIKSGAVNFLSKPFNETDLFKSIKEALAIYSESVIELEEKKEIQTRVEKLTNREYEILTYVITGMLNKNIAAELNISEKTVKVHRGRVMEKLNVDSVAELVNLANKAGIEPTKFSS
jgi:FixJ family two-component response regulator